MISFSFSDTIMSRLLFLSLKSIIRHLDVPYWSFTSLNAISIWIALDDATLENGCMYFMPGSHKVRE
jgi:ectoine hydroxylase-related dioxygenase (phytanoyl-CoA dioxygenase family)